jgi:hypothetical protein
MTSIASKSMIAGMRQRQLRPVAMLPSGRSNRSPIAGGLALIAALSDDSASVPTAFQEADSAA